MTAKNGYIIVISILLVAVCAIISVAIFTQIEATIRKVSLTVQRLQEKSDAIKVIATAGAYLRSKYSVANGFYLADHLTVPSDFGEVKNVIINSSGPVEKTVWQDFFTGGSISDVQFSTLKNLLQLASGSDSPLKKALIDSKAKKLIQADLSKIRVYAFSQSNDRSWLVLLCTNIGTSWAWALVGPEGFFNYAVFLPNGIPSMTYYGDGEVIDGPSWFGVDDRGTGGLGIGGSIGPRFYGKSFYRILRDYLIGPAKQSDVFLGGRVTLSDNDVAAFKSAYQGKVYWEAQLSSFEKVDIVDLAKGNANIPQNPAGLILTYSKLPNTNKDDLIINSSISKMNGNDVQIIEFSGPDGYFKKDGRSYQVELIIPFPGPPNVPISVVATETESGKRYTSSLPSFNGFLGLLCETTNSSIGIGKKDSWNKNIFMGDWTILVMGNKGRQEEQTPWDTVKIYTDIEYYSARDDSTMIVEYQGKSYEVFMNPFFADKTPIPNNRDVKGRLKLVDGSQTLELIDGKTFWDAWYKKLAQVGSKDHINLITTGDIIVPWHDGYKTGSGIRNLRMDMSIFTMYWDRNKKPGQGNQVLVPTFKVDYSKFQGLSYRVVFGSIASEAVTATWSGSKGLKEFNIFDNRLYSAKRGFSPMTGAILLEGLRLR